MGRREEILVAATKLFVHWGFKKTTIEDIATSCGLERASVYYYFKNKEEILEDVVRREVDRQAAIVLAAQQREHSAPSRLRALFRGHLEAFRSSELSTLSPSERGNVIQVLPQAFQFIQAQRQQLTELTYDIIAAGVAAGELAAADPRQMSEGIRTLVIGHAMACFLEQGVSDAAATAAFDALVRGMEVEPA